MSSLSVTVCLSDRCAHEKSFVKALILSYNMKSEECSSQSAIAILDESAM